MKLIHCADLHLDSKMETNLDREKAAERKSELFDTFRRMVSYADDNGVRAVIIAGDMFDTAENMQLRIKRRVLSVMREAHDVDFLYIKGNHDGKLFLENEEKPENLKLFSDSWTSYSYGSVVITGRDYEACAGEDSDFYRSLDLDGDKINIVALHQTASRYSGNGGEGSISLSLLKDKNIDYLALGHLHSYSRGKLDDRGIYCYSGCLEGRGFDECGEKGFVLLDIPEDDPFSKRRIKAEFVPFSYRCIREVKIELSGSAGDEELEGLVSKALSDIPESDLVRVVLCGEVDENTDIDTEYLEKRFGDTFYYLKFKDETRLLIRPEDFMNDISLKGEFIRLVSEKKLKREDKQEIIMMGLRALSHREIDIWK